MPLFPFLLWQAVRVRKNVPSLDPPLDVKGSINARGKKMNLLTLGESTIAGIGINTQQNGITVALAQELSKRFDIEINWEVCAKSGYTAQQVNQLLVSTIQNDPDLIVIGLGANNAFALHPPFHFRLQIEALIQRLQTKYKGVPIVFAHLPPIYGFPALTPLLRFFLGGLIRLYTPILRTLTNKYDDFYFIEEPIEFEKWLQKLGGNYQINDFFSDGVHPSALTYQLWGQEIGRFIEETNVLHAVINKKK